MLLRILRGNTALNLPAHKINALGQLAQLILALHRRCGDIVGPLYRLRRLLQSPDGHRSPVEIKVASDEAEHQNRAPCG
ncbi:hypothetical protein D3C87_2057790 [compost metagenome]